MQPIIKCTKHTSQSIYTINLNTFNVRCHLLPEIYQRANPINMTHPQKKHSQCLQRVLVKTWDTFCLYCLSACGITKCQSVFFFFIIKIFYQSTLVTSSDLSSFLNGKPSHSWCMAKTKQNKNVTQAKLEAPSCYAIQNALAYFATLRLF